MAEHDVAQHARTEPTASPEKETRLEAQEWEATRTELESRVEELNDRWRRAAAELDNFRKRVTRERAADREDERNRVAARWLPVIDNLDLALGHAEAGQTAILEGVRAVREQALAVLAELGFARREDLGQTFDPARHEAVGTVVDDEAPAGTVVHVARPGYGPDEHLLRPASVVVSTRS